MRPDSPSLPTPWPGKSAAAPPGQGASCPTGLHERREAKRQLLPKPAGQGRRNWDRSEAESPSPRPSGGPALDAKGRGPAGPHASLAPLASRAHAPALGVFSSKSIPCIASLSIAFSESILTLSIDILSILTLSISFFWYSNYRYSIPSILTISTLALITLYSLHSFLSSLFQRNIIKKGFPFSPSFPLAHLASLGSLGVFHKLASLAYGGLQQVIYEIVLFLVGAGACVCASALCARTYARGLDGGLVAIP